MVTLKYTNKVTILKYQSICVSIPWQNLDSGLWDWTLHWIMDLMFRLDSRTSYSLVLKNGNYTDSYAFFQPSTQSTLYCN